ncbi:hypothetical protein [Methylobacterium sp. ARG-1]|uniref:hypothetical protein n=1 Tax=Methylobacterium sp. ARG-1 TaxID=1692501 RepID=UPI000AB6E2DB|nr:hypothetical protein [Methylobacterium sp. ARG-1]
MEAKNANHRESYHLKYPDLNDTRKSIKLLLGRDPLSSHEVRHYSSCDYATLLKKLVKNDEFQQEIFLPLILTGYSASGRYNGEPSPEMLRWISEKVPLDQCVKGKINQRTTWRRLLSTIWGTGEFLNRVREAAGPLQSIERFQQRLSDSPNDSVSGIAPAFSRPKIQVPNCKMLIVEAIGSKDFDLTERIDLTGQFKETHNLRKIEAYVAGDDPQIIIHADVIGRFVLDIEVEYTHSIADPEKNYMQIFFDFGDGYEESASYALGTSNNKVSAIVLLNAEKRIQNLRIDPSVRASTFIIRRLVLSKL